MNFKKLRPRHFVWALPIALPLSLGSCAAPKPSAQMVETQIAKTPIATVQKTPVQTPQINVQKLTERRVYASAVAALQFSTDSQTLASAGGTKQNAAFANMPSGALKVEMLDAKTLRATKTLPPLPAVYHAAFSYDLNKIVIVSRFVGGLQLVDMANGKISWREYVKPRSKSPFDDSFAQAHSIVDLKFSLRGDQIIACCEGRTGEFSSIELWSVKSRELKKEDDLTIFTVPNSGQSLSTTAAACSPNGRKIVKGSLDSALASFDTKSGKAIWYQMKYYEDFNYNNPIGQLAFSPDAKIIASAHNDMNNDEGSITYNVKLRLWNAQNGALLQTIKAHSKVIRNVVFSPDSSVVASGADDGIVALSSTRNGATLGTLNAKHGSVTALTWAPDGKQLAAGYADGTVALWRVR